MTDKKEKILHSAVRRLLTPLVRLLLRNGVPLAIFEELARKVYVDVAFNEFVVPGKKQTATRVSTITGLSRKEVARFQQQSTDDLRASIQQQHRTVRVIYGWVNDPRFVMKNHHTRALSFDQGDNSFSTLVKEYSGDMTPRAIYDELLQKGVIRVDNVGQIHLLERAYIPTTDEVEKLVILGLDVSGLISTIDRNIYQTDKPPFFQRKVYYDNLPEEAVPEIRQLVEQRGQELLEQINLIMAKHDRDMNPEVKGSGKKAAGVGVFYFENDEQDPENNS